MSLLGDGSMHSAWRMRREDLPLAALIVVLAALALIVLVGPVLVVAVTSLSTSAALRFPPPGLTLRWYAELFGPARSDVIQAAALNSVEVALLAGDPENERVGEVLSVVPPGRRDLGMEQVRATDAIEQATGVRPTGYFCRGSASPHTRALLCERGYAYDSNALDDDLPYRCRETGILVLPYALDSNDMKFFHPNGFVLPDAFAG